MYVYAARDAGATPVFVTPLPRLFYDFDGKLLPTHGDYPYIMRAVAESMGVTLIDLGGALTLKINEMGEDEARKMFVDNTHPNALGAEMAAQEFLRLSQSLFNKP